MGEVVANIDFEKIVAFKAIKNAAFESDKLPSRLKILNWGVNNTVIGPVNVGATSSALLQSSQDAKGFSEIAIDFEHNTVNGSVEFNRTVEPRAVAGYGTPSIVPDDGIYLENIRWTPEGQRMAMNYSDLSPALLTDTSGAVTFIHSVALCRNGAVEGLTFHSATANTDELKSLAAKKVPISSGQKVKKGSSVIALEESEIAAEDKKVNYKDFPAWELVRVEPRDIPRGASGKPGDLSWPDRWKQCGGKLFDGRMIANKLDPIWGMLGDSEEFDDAVDSEVPPFAYNSGYGWNEVDAQTCKELGVRRTIRGKQSDKKMPPVSLRNFSADNTNNINKGNTMENISVEELAQALGLPVTATKEECLKALSCGAGKKEEDMAKMTAPLVEQLKAFSAKIEKLESEPAASIAAAEKVERQNLIEQATKEGKVIPLSADAVGALPMSALKEMISNLKPGMVTMSASGATTKTVELKGIDRTVKAFEAQVQANGWKK